MIKLIIIFFSLGFLGSCEDLVQNKDAAPNEVSSVTTDGDDSAGEIEIDESDAKAGYEGERNAALLEGAVLAVDVVPTGALQLGDSALALNGANLAASPPYFGQSTSASLKSLKYYITSIQLCESIEISGTGYNNPKNCIDVFRTKSDPNYDQFKYAEAVASDEGYIDLMNPESIKKLSQNLKLGENEVGKYNFGLVNWMQPIKFTTEISMSNGSTLYSKDHEPTWTDDGNGWSYWRNNPTSLSGPAEEAVVIHSNGGAWFKFASPLEVTEADIASETKFQLDLTFNPEALISATYQTPGNGDSNDIDPNPGYKIDVPLLALTPIAHKLEDPVKVETYSFRFTGTNPSEQAQELASTEIDYRVQIYYLENDPEKSVFGVNIHQLYTENTRSLEGLFLGQVFTVKSNEDGSLGLIDWQDNQLIDGFMRFDTVSDEGAATTKQGHNREHTVDLSYRLISDEFLRDPNGKFFENPDAAFAE